MAKRGQGEGSISKRPDGTWWARITIGKDEDGKQKRKAFYGKTRKEVQEKLTAALNDVNNDTYIDPSRMTVAQWMDIWLKEYKYPHLRTSTLSCYFKNIKNHVKPGLGHCKLKDLRNDTVQKFVNSLIEKGLATGSIEHINMVLSSALDQAVENGMIAKNVAAKIKLPKKEKTKINVLTTEEQEKFIEAAKSHDGSEIFTLMLCTGLRVGEAQALTWDDIDFQNAELHVNKTQTRGKDPYKSDTKRAFDSGPPKTKSSYRTIPLIPKAVELLKRVKREQEAHMIRLGPAFIDNNLVFCNPTGGQLRHSGLSKKFSRITAKIGVEGLHIHCLRHTFATRGLESGIEMKVMQELLGHATLSMTADTYIHVLPSKKSDSMMKLNDAITL